MIKLSAQVTSTRSESSALASKKTIYYKGPELIDECSFLNGIGLSSYAESLKTHENNQRIAGAGYLVSSLCIGGFGALAIFDILGPQKRVSVPSAIGLGIGASALTFGIIVSADSYKPYSLDYVIMKANQYNDSILK